jgi:hypothetical protein
MSGLPNRDRWVVALVALLLATLIAGFALSAPAFGGRPAATDARDSQCGAQVRGPRSGRSARLQPLHELHHQNSRKHGAADDEVEVRLAEVKHRADFVPGHDLGLREHDAEEGPDQEVSQVPHQAPPANSRAMPAAHKPPAKKESTAYRLDSWRFDRPMMA